LASIGPSGGSLFRFLVKFEFEYSDMSGHCSSIEAFGVAMKSFEKSEEAQEDPGLLLRSSIT
jgi:hypothetical protein